MPLSYNKQFGYKYLIENKIINFSNACLYINFKKYIPNYENNNGKF